MRNRSVKPVSMPLCFGVWLCLLTPASCTQTPEPREIVFDPAEISCSTQHLPATDATMRLMRKGWLQDRKASEVNTILDDLRRLANQGDPEAMLVWGLVRHKIIIDKFLDQKYDQTKTVPSLDDIKDDIVMAMTYALIAFSIGNDEQQAMARKLMREIEHDLSPILQVSPSWSEEAETNATQWNARCGHQVSRYERHAAPFRAEEVSCHIHAIPEAHKKIHEVYTHPNGDLYFIGNADVLMTRMRKFADQGDPESMYFIGSLKHEATMISLTDVPDDGADSKLFPEYTKADMITALSYLSLSAHLAGEHQVKAQTLMQKIKNGRWKTLRVPPLWIEQAETNTKHWKARCMDSTEKK